MMKKGIAASKGYAIGKVFLKDEEEIIISSEPAKDALQEKASFEQAVDASRSQLEAIKEKVLTTMGEDEAAVFEAHIMVLQDPEFTGAMALEIENNGLNALHAVSNVRDMFVGIFESMDDPYMRERAADIKDVAARLLANIAGKSIGFEIKEADTIVVANDLTPSDTAQLDKRMVSGFLTNIGGSTSHSAIMARTLEIPAVVGLKDITKLVKDGDTVIVDGINGNVIINPDQETLIAYKAKRESFLEEEKKLEKYIDAEAITKAGKRIEVAGNIGQPEDVDAVIAYGGDGVGLFRTEFLYMDRNSAPTEDEQYESYKYVLDKMAGKLVVIRTLDIGGDKILPYLPMPEEMNPFLGYRAIRLCLDQKDLFKTQIKALLRASVHGNLAVMFPMISGLAELQAAMEVVEECKAELKAAGSAYSDQIQWGIMVEIPAAAVCAEQLAQHVDFFSIGTNDLIQYTLAVDRMSEKVSYLYDPMHPAVLSLIKMTIDGAHKHGKWVGMCGEMAGDPKAIPTLLAYGLDEFSMSATSILNAKKIITEN